MPSIFVSICIPAYNAERYLEATLRSVASQSFEDWELIVVEDGTKDGTEEIVSRFAEQVSQPVVYTRHQLNRGLPATRNTGIASARGEWIAFLDADDLWKPDHLEGLVRAARGTSCDLVFSGTESFDDLTGETLGHSSPTAGDLENLAVALYSGKLSVLPSSVMVSREAFARFGLVSGEYPHVNDTEYWLRILRLGGSLAYSGAVTCLYRKHATSMSRRAAELLTDSARLCERYADWGALPRALRRHRPADLYRWAARTLLPEDPHEAFRIARHALWLEPSNPKNIGLWLKSMVQSRRAA